MTGTARTTRDAPCARATWHGGARRRAGGDAIVHDHRCTAAQVQTGAVAPVAPRPPLQLDPLLPLDGTHVDGAEGGRRHDVLVLHPHPVLADGSHRQLGLERDPELPHDDDVERCRRGPAPPRRPRGRPPGAARAPTTSLPPTPALCTTPARRRPASDRSRNLIVTPSPIPGERRWSWVSAPPGDRPRWPGRRGGSSTRSRCRTSRAP